MSAPLVFELELADGSIETVTFPARLAEALRRFAEKHDLKVEEALRVIVDVECGRDVLLGTVPS